MDNVGMCLLAFLIIATCGRSVESRSVGWVMAIVSAVAMLTIWLVGTMVANTA